MNILGPLNKEDLLKPEYMIQLYSRGAFPMADETGEIDWYFPDVRTIIPLDNFNIPRSLKKFLLQSDFKYTFDKDTIEVIKNCADREKTWISPKLILAYKGLLNNGYLHSVEVKLKNKLVGGLYGVTYHGAFYGESMFSKVSQTSKAALVKLVFRLREKGFKLLDVQFQTEHLKMFGAVEISLEKFTELQNEAIAVKAQF